jgi:hypothetical protein
MHAGKLGRDLVLTAAKLEALNQPSPLLIPIQD